MDINPEIFRGFSIRGVVGVDFDAAAVKDIGRGIGTWFRQHAAKTIVTGYDVRLSSPQLHEALCEGLVLTGINVIDIGLTPTPMLNFSVGHFSADGGVMVTASHNTAKYNGLKICSHRTVYGSDLEDIHRLVAARRFEIASGNVEKSNPAEAYLQAISQRISIKHPLRVVVDGGNGANGLLVPRLLRRLGCEVTEIHCNADGNFPARGPDPTKEGATDALCQAVVSAKADIGLAFDGDGDRVVLVDENGQKVSGDLALMLLFDDVLSVSHNKKIVYEVLCSMAVPEFILSHGGTPIQAPSGYAYVHNLLLEHNAQTGGETSGHIFLLDQDFKFDDAILASARLVQILSLEDEGLSKRLSRYPVYHASPEYRPSCPDKYKTEIVRSLGEEFRREGYPLEEVDGVRVDFGNAWALIRQSNTQPALSLRFESKISHQHMNQVKEAVLKRLMREYQSRQMPWQDDIFN
ncbi:MAG: phosphomannomutase/phosphoglucomutase [Chloroflexota bacterium]